MYNGIIRGMYKNCINKGMYNGMYKMYEIIVFINV